MRLAIDPRASATAFSSEGLRAVWPFSSLISWSATVTVSWSSKISSANIRDVRTSAWLSLLAAPAVTMSCRRVLMWAASCWMRSSWPSSHRIG